MEEYQVPYLRLLFDRKIDGEFFILQSNGGYCDIAQYSSKFQTIKFISCREDRLDYSLKMNSTPAHY